MDKIETHKGQSIIFPDKTEFKVKRGLQKTLRANCFLLLYNLVEASIRNGIVAIFDAIHDDNLSYQELSIKIQEIWLSNKALDLAKNSNSKKVRQSIKSMFSDILNNAEIFLESGKISISGNLDYREIESLINKYGIHRSVSQKEKVGKALLRVKSERNFLAHGNKSFQKSAEIITTKELIEYKDLIINYLQEIIESIEMYISNKGFKRK